MKGFLIFLACAVPVVLLSPFFWTLVHMNFGAERIGYVHGKGKQAVTQWATLGPKAPWPRWAVVPQGAKLTVGANFEAAPGFAATGYGDIAGSTPPRLVADRYRQELERGGWTVRTGRFDASSPDIPPRAIHNCIVEGRKGGAVQRLSIAIDGSGTEGSLWWTVGEAKFPAGTRDSPCWG